MACRQSAENTLALSLEPLAERLPICGRCLQRCPLIHERRMRLVRERDPLDQRILLQLPVRRLDCLTCGRVGARVSRTLRCI